MAGMDVSLFTDTLSVTKFGGKGEGNELKLPPATVKLVNFLGKRGNTLTGLFNKVN